MPPPDPAIDYECEELVTTVEMTKALAGVGVVEFFGRDVASDTPGLPQGETYCQYLGSGYAVAVTIATGPAFTLFATTLGSAASGANVEQLPGIGDRAVYVAGTVARGAARLGGTLVLTAIDPPVTGSEKVDARAATIAILQLVVSRL